MSRKVLVTGAAGFVGSHLVPALRLAGHTVIPCSLRHGDLERVDAAPDHVIHLSARTFVPDSWRDPLGFYETNVMGTARVLELCRRYDCRFTLLSSYVYGRPGVLPVAEDHPLQPTNPYAASKILAEQLAAFYEEGHRVPVTILRPFNLYGPGQSAPFLIPELIARAKHPSTSVIEVMDDRPRRDYLYIDDLVKLLVLQIQNPKSGVYNSGFGASHSVLEVAQAIAGIIGNHKQVRSLGQHRAGEILDTVADISRARAAFGWYPEVNLCSGLTKTIESL